MRFPWVNFVKELEDFFLLFAGDHFVFGHLGLLVAEAFLKQLRFVGGVGARRQEDVQDLRTAGLVHRE